MSTHHVNPKILSPLRDPSFWTAIGASVVGEAAAVAGSHGAVMAAPMLVAALPLLVWLRAHAKHRIAALDAAVELAHIAEGATPAQADASETPA